MCAQTVKKVWKKFVSSEKVRTFASAFAQMLGAGMLREEFFERLT
jgi:hypothetical protein